MVVPMSSIHGTFSTAWTLCLRWLRIHDTPLPSVGNGRQRAAQGIVAEDAFDP